MFYRNIMIIRPVLAHHRHCLSVQGGPVRFSRQEKMIDSHHHPKRNGRGIPSSELIIKAGSVGSEEGIDIMEQIPHEIMHLSIEEAIVSMEDQERDFLLFNNTESGKLSFVYKRSDGHYGVIDSLD